MPSAAEQLAANFNFNSFSKAKELKQRILFTLAVLVVCRLGTYIPMPGIDPAALTQQLNQQQGGILDVFNVLAGGAIERMAIFALGIMPYISASIIIQLMTTVFPELEALKKEGAAGQKVINQYTRYGTVGLGALQAYGIAIGLEHWGNVVIDPGWFFRFTAVLTLTGGTVLLMWLGEQITSRGVGNGISLIIFAGIVARFPQMIGQAFEAGRTGAISPFFIVVGAIFIIALVLGIVFMERAQRRLLVQYPKRQWATACSAAIFTFAVEAERLRRYPADFCVVHSVDAGHGRQFQRIRRARLAAIHRRADGQGQPLYLALYAGLILFFAFSIRRSFSTRKKQPTI